jgi:hypothetical protein
MMMGAGLLFNDEPVCCCADLLAREYLLQMGDNKFIHLGLLLDLGCVSLGSLFRLNVFVLRRISRCTSPCRLTYISHDSESC